MVGSLHAPRRCALRVPRPPSAESPLRPELVAQVTTEGRACALGATLGPSDLWARVTVDACTLVVKIPVAK